jgi:predicted dienelactone hydrolase
MVAAEVVTWHDASRPDWGSGGPRPIRAHLWRPANGEGEVQTILVSHGAGGAARQMAWLALPLAAAGYLAVAVDHHGNNFVDGYVAEGFARWWERPLDFAVVLDRLSERESIGPVGVAGFSIGGYTAAALLGARIDAGRYASLLSGEIGESPPPEYPTLADELRARLTDADVASWVAESGRDYSDARVRAGFLACPGVGRMLDEESLAAVDRPVAIRWAGADDITPPRDNAEVYLDLIPGAKGESTGPEVGHYAFLADNPEFEDVRAQVASDAVAFFDAHFR